MPAPFSHSVTVTIWMENIDMEKDLITTDFFRR